LYFLSAGVLLIWAMAACKQEVQESCQHVRGATLFVMISIFPRLVEGAFLRPRVNAQGFEKRHCWVCAAFLLGKNCPLTGPCPVYRGDPIAASHQDSNANNTASVVLDCDSGPFF